jgi:hypothetical protein
VANETITWPNPPDVTDTNDGSQAYNLGREFTLTAELPIVGIEWRVPDSVADPQGGPHAVSLWDKAGDTRLLYEEIVPTPGALRQFFFDASHLGEVGPTYVAAVYTNHYAYRSGAAAGSTSPSGAVVAGDSVLAAYNSGAASAPRPLDVSTANFYISPIVSDDEPEDHTTAGTAGAIALATAVSSGTRPTVGIGGCLATATAAATTTRGSAGSAPALGAATASVATTRTTVASAAAVATATGSGAVVRTTTGTARALATASAYTASGAPGPRLVSRGRVRPIVDRVRRA